MVISRRVEDPIGISPGDRVFQQDGGTLKKSRNSFEYRVKFVNIISFPQKKVNLGDKLRTLEAYI